MSQSDQVSNQFKSTLDHVRVYVYYIYKPVAREGSGDQPTPLTASPRFEVVVACSTEKKACLTIK